MHDRLALSQAETGGEPLHRRVARCKGRWLKRAMRSAASPPQKVFAFFVFDHLNCVTLDAWPSQETVAEYMRCSTKTIKRAADGLQAISLIRVRRAKALSPRPRYAPVFTPSDWDVNVQEVGRRGIKQVDTGVYESTLDIHLTKSIPTGWRGSAAEAVFIPYKRAERGRWEVELIEALGPDGHEIVETLGHIDDAIIDRLCRSVAEACLGEREMEAARLAALQARVGRRFG